MLLGAAATAVGVLGASLLVPSARQFGTDLEAATALQRVAGLVVEPPRSGHRHVRSTYKDLNVQDGPLVAVDQFHHRGVGAPERGPLIEVR
ncbi:hypothetical protein [Actinosynnema pretiosum]|uniref:hypothetical protein n=1 Tax=Actinosynnema pretiosum TaxID=42197 RepID=UPI001E36C8AC|nr:hypothetical protein [Actinosynnema pretiosum]